MKPHDEWGPADELAETVLWMLKGFMATAAIFTVCIGVVWVYIGIGDLIHHHNQRVAWLATPACTGTAPLATIRHGVDGVPITLRCPLSNAQLLAQMQATGCQDGKCVYIALFDQSGHGNDLSGGPGSGLFVPRDFGP